MVDPAAAAAAEDEEEGKFDPARLGEVSGEREEGRGGEEVL